MVEIPEEYEQPETVITDPYAYEPQAPMPFNVWQVQTAALGDLLCIPLDQEVPDGWLKCEPVTVTREEYPEFFEALKLSSDAVDLPEAMNTDLQMFIIKMRDISARSPE